MLEKPLLFSIKPGVVAAWNARTVVIIAPSDGSSPAMNCVLERHLGSLELSAGSSKFTPYLIYADRKSESRTVDFTFLCRRISVVAVTEHFDGP